MCYHVHRLPGEEEKYLKKRIISASLGIIFLAGCSQASGMTPSESYNPLPDFQFTKFNYTYKPTALDVYADYDFTVLPSTRPVVEVPIVKASVKPKKAPRRAQNVPVVSKTAAQKYARKRLGNNQYSCIYNLFNKESGWRWNAYNKNSGAYGIPQALPGRKMASAGDDWKTNPITQVKWGIGYVNGRYGSACGAWRFWLNNHWY